MNKTFKSVILVYFILLFILWIVVFKLGLGVWTYNYYQANHLFASRPKSLNVIGIFIVIVINILSAICSIPLAGKRGRNKVFWFLLSALFNIWPLLILALLPRRKNKGDGTMAVKLNIL